MCFVKAKGRNARVAKKASEKPVDAVMTIGLTACSKEEEKLKPKRGMRIALIGKCKTQVCRLVKRRLAGW